MIAKLSLATAVLAFTAGSALAGGDCSYKMHTAQSTPPAAEATPVDVATLVPPVLPETAEPATATTVPAEPVAQ